MSTELPRMDSSAAPIPVRITRIPITGMIGCCVPVVPGTPEIDAPVEQRTERCGIDANWVVGSIPTCDIHAEIVCGVAHWGWPELWQEAGRSAESIAVPWADRQRHSQESTQEHYDHFTEGGAR